MNDTLATLCSDFIDNRDCIRSVSGWDSTYMYPVCAAIFTDKGQKADAERIRRCRDILKEQTGPLSNFRGTGKLALISMLAVDGNPEGKLQRALLLYQILKKHFFASNYLPLVSMIVADMEEPARYEEIAANTRHIYDLMKKEHPFLTSGEDSVFAALLSFSDLSDEQVVRETESCYNILKTEFYSGNAVQSLSHVLALGEGTAEEKCRRTTMLFKALKEKGCRYGTSYELATLGVLALLKEDLSALTEDMIEVDAFLSGQKGYRGLGLGKKQRLMHAGMLVTSAYIGQHDSRVMNPAAIGGTLSLIAAQQAAVCSAVAASAAAGAAASD